jgi:hypothetical protein
MITGASCPGDPISAMQFQPSRASVTIERNSLLASRSAGLLISTRRRGLLQAANVLFASKILVESDDFASSKLESNFRDQVIRKPHTAFAGSF